jgi:hypothetical protein
MNESNFLYNSTVKLSALDEGSSEAEAMIWKCESVLCDKRKQQRAKALKGMESEALRNNKSHKRIK